MIPVDWVICNYIRYVRTSIRKLIIRNFTDSVKIIPGTYVVGLGPGSSSQYTGFEQYTVSAKLFVAESRPPPPPEGAPGGPRRGHPAGGKFLRDMELRVELKIKITLKFGSCVKRQFLVLGPQGRMVH